MRDTLDSSSKIVIGDFDMFDQGIFTIPDFFEAAGFHAADFRIISKDENFEKPKLFQDEKDYLQYLYNRCYYNEDD